MEIVKNIRDGNVDKNKNQDSDSISPTGWRDHFSDLLGTNVKKTDQHKSQEEFIKNNLEYHNKIFEQPLSKSEILRAINSFKNNKSTSFDLVSNEMLKSSLPILLDPIYVLFTTMVENSLYASAWKLDILSPVHKKGLKDDPNNYRGIAVSSHFGKLFNTVLKN